MTGLDYLVSLADEVFRMLIDSLCASRAILWDRKPRATFRLTEFVESDDDGVVSGW